MKLKISVLSNNNNCESLDDMPSACKMALDEVATRVETIHIDEEDNDPSKVVMEDELSRQNLYKTELCRSFVETGICRYGHKCQFAHGTHEIRPVVRHPKYKTEVCKKFASTGHCPYGVRCRFIHPVVNTPIVPASSPSVAAHANQSAVWSNSWATPSNVPTPVPSNATAAPANQSVVWSNSWATPSNVAEQKKTMMKDMPKKSLPAPIGTPTASGGMVGEGSSARRLAFFQSIA